MYYSVALFTATGGHTPKTKGGRLLMVVLGFSNIVFLAAYTANLATYLTVSHEAIQTIHSLSDAVNLGRKVCILEQDMSIMNTLYPHVSASLVRIKDESRYP